MDGKEFKKTIRKRLVDKNYHSLNDFWRKELSEVISKPTFCRIINDPGEAKANNIILIMDLLEFSTEEKVRIFE